MGETKVLNQPDGYSKLYTVGQREEMSFKPGQQDKLKQLRNPCWFSWPREVLPSMGGLKKKRKVFQRPTKENVCVFVCLPQIRRRRPTPATLQIYRQPGTGERERKRGRETERGGGGVDGDGGGIERAEKATAIMEPLLDLCCSFW